MRLIGAWSHGILDYAIAVIFFVGPSSVGFVGKQAMICYALGAVHLILTALTRFPLGVKKVIGFPIHGAIELVAAIMVLAMPWIAGFSAGVRSRNFFLLIGLLLAIIWFVTDYRGIGSQKAESKKQK
ncbi:MAG TPA: hypothetical protein VEZ11_02135 [Thermoanaerobaculia bacterium]|nr:hypothetical protein [Thermoanaerobaculia bacterium]